MGKYKAILFDLDDTLLDRDQAVENLFFVILETCYGDVKDSVKNIMLEKFKEYDKGNYGDGNKVKVIEPFFDEFPPKHRIPSSDIQTFWNHHFPNCFSVNQNIINILNTIKKQVKVAIITNGSTERQKAKIVNTNLDNLFEVIIISEEVGLSKPDKRIYELALKRLNVQPESALFVGDNLELDIGGPQNVNMRGIWFNPQGAVNNTEIKPFAEISSFDELLSFV